MSHASILKAAIRIICLILAFHCVVPSYRHLEPVMIVSGYKYTTARTSFLNPDYFNFTSGLSKHSKPVSAYNIIHVLAKRPQDPTIKPSNPESVGYIPPEEPSAKRYFSSQGIHVNDTYKFTIKKNKVIRTGLYSTKSELWRKPVTRKFIAEIIQDILVQIEMQNEVKMIKVYDKMKQLGESLNFDSVEETTTLRMQYDRGLGKYFIDNKVVSFKPDEDHFALAEEAEIRNNIPAFNIKPIDFTPKIHNRKKSVTTYLAQVRSAPIIRRNNKILETQKREFETYTAEANNSIEVAAIGTKDDYFSGEFNKNKLFY